VDRQMKSLHKLVRIACWGSLIVGLLSGCISSVTPSPYPTQPITYLVPFDPGGQSDRIVRAQIPYLQRSLGQDVVIDYLSGQGGALGWAETAHSTPDGYTLATVNLPYIVLQPMFGNVNYKTEDLDCIATLATTPFGLAVLETSPYQTLQGLLDAAKSAPGTITLGGFAEYTAIHMVFLQLQKVTGVEFKYVAYTGGSAEQMIAFLGGNVDAVLANADDLWRNQDAVRVLAMAEEFAELPDVPTFAELGVDVGSVGSTDRSVAVPAGTPEDVVVKLEEAFLALARDPEFQAEMQRQGFVPVVKGREETRAALEDLKATYTQLADLVNP